MRSRKFLAVFLCVGLLFAAILASAPSARAAGAMYTLSLNPDASEYTFARIPDREVEAGTLVGPLPVLARDGYHFGGWYTGETGSGEQYTSQKAMPAHDVTLYAYWYVGDPGAASDQSMSIPAATTDGRTVASVLLKSDAGMRIEMPRSVIQSAAEAGKGVTVDAVFAKIEFDSVAAEAVSTATDVEGLTVMVSTVEFEEQPAAVQAVTGGRPAYNFVLMAGDGQLSSLGGGSATIRIPYEIQPDEDPNAIVVYYIDDAGNPHVVRGAYNVDSSDAHFSVAHFSQYAVGYNKIVFTDVPENAAYYNAVTFAAAREITTGTGDGMFSPDNTLTRGQFITMLMRAYGISPDENPQDNFDDAGNDYYTGFIAAAKRLGISDGVGNNLFMPDADLSTQDMLTLLHRTLGLLGESPRKDTGHRLSDFSDADKVKDYAREAVESMIVAGAVQASGELNPAGAALRSAMVQALYALLSE